MEEMETKNIDVTEVIDGKKNSKKGIGIGMLIGTVAVGLFVGGKMALDKVLNKREREELESVEDDEEYDEYEDYDEEVVPEEE